jgi:hypothetical protein
LDLNIRIYEKRTKKGHVSKETCRDEELKSTALSDNPAIFDEGAIGMRVGYNWTIVI